jgi:ubiquitin carboxyl-terminal hydrolase L3
MTALHAAESSARPPPAGFATATAFAAAASTMGKKWVPLEANPDVLNDFAAKLGVSTTRFQFTDIWGLDSVGACRQQHRRNQLLALAAGARHAGCL